ncbi:isotrichodermin C-15 hydroxylase [Lophiostoma macrostomum CBS 122681]|uniref:Isotrichodermin C-15 hydroxylase n=1 Tax=Lophiostoma macrostomum CBS 122681 TaxID=1314788 RepID=A0A6A6SSY1_9PLEO|nr:isotrichodermin C-15 hydroxylase [Lophiostoma macrostomum CBS 122681]
MGYTEFLIGSNIWSWVFNLTVLVCLYPIAVWIYNAFFHSLAHFPGPLLWRASRLPYLRAVFSGHFPYQIQRLHEQYGDIVRIAPNELSFTDPTAWDDIYSNRDGANHEAFRKSELWHGNPDGGAASVFVTIDLKEHARIRRFMDPAFSERSVSQQEPILQAYIDLLITKLHDRASAKRRVTINLVDWINFTLFDMIGDLSFGESFGCLEKCEYEDWMSQMAAAIRLHYLSINLRYYPIITLLLKPLAGILIPKGLIKQQIDYRDRSAAKLKRRLESESADDRADIVSKLLRSEDREEGLTSDEVLLNSMLFINAASETTATVLTGVVNHLLQNPASLAELSDEIRQFSLSSDLELQALKQLPYLNALMRPGPIGHMRITPPNGGIVARHFVPGNTMLTVQPLALSYSPKYFHDPQVWHPERWLHDAETDPSSLFYHDQRKGVRAFGWGPYNCVGEPLGWAWMRLILAKLVWTFDLEMAASAGCYFGREG